MHKFATMFAATVIGTVLMSSLAADEPSAQRLQWAERIAELQRVHDFHQAEWDFQMRMMREHFGEDEAFGAPEHLMEVMRAEQVEGQTEEWILTLAESFDVERLQAVAESLDSDEYRAWTTDQLEVYPAYLDRMMGRMEAVGEVMVEEVSESDAIDPQQPDFEGLEPIIDERLAGAFEYAPGARIDVELESGWMQSYRVPASQKDLAEVFQDLEIELVPDGDRARVRAVSAQRSFASGEACESARSRLEGELSDLFEYTEITDCGDVRHFSAGGDTRLSLYCRDQDAIGVAELQLSVVHQPTQDAAFADFMVRMEEQEEDAAQLEAPE